MYVTSPHKKTTPKKKPPTLKGTDLIAAFKHFHREQKFDNRWLSRLTERGIISSNSWNSNSEKFKLELQNNFFNCARN